MKVHILKIVLLFIGVISLVVACRRKKPVKVALKDAVVSGTWTDIFTESGVEIARGRKMKMEPWGYMVLVK